MELILRSPMRIQYVLLSEVEEKFYLWFLSKQGQVWSWQDTLRERTVQQNSSI